MGEFVGRGDDLIIGDMAILTVEFLKPFEVEPRGIWGLRGVDGLNVEVETASNICATSFSVFSEPFRVPVFSTKNRIPIVSAKVMVTTSNLIPLEIAAMSS